MTLVNFTYLENLHDRRRKVTNKAGLNNLGFRSNENYYKNDTGNLFLGCSITEGVGVDLNETWSSILNTSLEGKFISLAKGGSGSDTWFSYLLMFIDYFNPLKVFLLGYPYSRFEYFDSEKFIPAFMANKTNFQKKYPNFSKDILFSKEYAEYNYYKNLLAIKQLCSTREIPFYSLETNCINYPDFGSDNLHPGPKYHSEIAKRFKNLI